MAENKNLICIQCPVGCTLYIGQELNDTLKIEGNQCARGREYAMQEYVNPIRTLTTTASTIFKDIPVAAVRTSVEIPLKDIFLYMNAVKKIKLTQRLKSGDIIARGLLGNDVNLILTTDMEEIKI